MRTIHSFIEEGVPKYVRGRLLDVGGGWGRWKSTLSPYTTTYLISDPYAAGADFSDDARNLSNPDNSFDTVVCFEALEHIDDTRKVIENLYRVVKEGGHVIATAPFMYARHGNPSDYYRFTPAGFEFLFREAGFTIVESGGLGSLTTVLGCVFKAKHKKSKGMESKFYMLLHKLCMLLPDDRDEDFFTNSYVVAKKP